MRKSILIGLGATQRRKKNARRGFEKKPDSFLWGFIAKIFCVVALFIALMMWSLPSAAQSGVTIDPRVLQDTENGASGKFLVVLKSQVNTRAIAARAPNRAEQGKMVYEALRDNAQLTQAAPRAQLDALGAKYRAYSVANVLAVEGNRTAVNAMAARSDVQAIETDRVFHVNLEPTQPYGVAAPATIEWNISKIRADLVWTAGYSGTGGVYANADTGVQWDHPALKPQYRGWNGSSADHNYNWWDAIHSNISGSAQGACDGWIALPSSGSTVPCDDYGHGTHTMGTGIGDDGMGNQIGVAPGAKWIACRNMDNGAGRPSTYIECMNFFLAPTDLSGNNPDPSKAPDAVGNSYACPYGPPPGGETCAVDSLQTAVDNMRSAGIFMAVSAGNEGYNGCSTILEPPSFYDSSITVGATDSSDNIASFSNRGPITIDGSNRRKPDLVAPGVNVRSSYPTNTYASLQGTSMASPHVAGAVVLLWTAFPNIRKHVDVTEQILENTAVHLTTSQGCGGDSASLVPNNVYGYGRLDVYAAYNYIANNPFVFKYIFPLIMK